MDFKYGIEHEVAFLRPDGAFSDFSNTVFEEFDEIIDVLPVYESDYTQLRIGDAGIRFKRWYIEGFERFDSEGGLLRCIPKGIEVRTLIHSSIDSAIAELSSSYDILLAESGLRGFTPISTSYNPCQKSFQITPPLNDYEKRNLAQHGLKKIAIPMMTYGPDLNISASGFDDSDLYDIARKLTYYTPFIIPFSFSSPFAESTIWRGLSARTHLRAGHRASVMVYMKGNQFLAERYPLLTKKARLEAEIGRIEFKAFDSCFDFRLYASLFALLKGMILDASLLGKSEMPNSELLRRSALKGFSDSFIHKTCEQVLAAAYDALDDSRDRSRLELLRTMLSNRDCPSKWMLEAARNKNDKIITTLLSFSCSPFIDELDNSPAL